MGLTISSELTHVWLHWNKIHFLTIKFESPKNFIKWKCKNFTHIFNELSGVEFFPVQSMHVDSLLNHNLTCFKFNLILIEFLKSDQCVAISINLFEIKFWSNFIFDIPGWFNFDVKFHWNQMWLANVLNF